MPVFTVLGPIEASELGPTSMHEHCLLDATVWVAPSPEEVPADPRVCIENLGFVRWNFESLADNLRIDDVDLASRELGSLRSTPGAAIVDLTNVGLGRRVEDVAAVSRASGVHVVVGCGLYVDAAHPDWSRSLSVDELAEWLIGELRDGIEDTGIRPGLIGEIGTSGKPTDGERRMVRAAGVAAAQTGAAVNVHLDPLGRNALDVIEILLEEGMPADRIVMSHLDAYLALDHGYHRAVADSGAIIEFDNFGLEGMVSHPEAGLLRNRTDLERLEALAGLLADGFAGQIVIGTDVYTKAQLRSFGGCGYDHLLKRIVPALRRHFDIDEHTVERIMVDTPRRVLDRPAIP